MFSIDETLDLQAEHKDSPTWPFVMKLAKYMERKLSENRHKGDAEGWRKTNCYNLIDRVREETDELYDEVAINDDEPEKIWLEAADVANMAMMVADCVETSQLRAKIKPTKSDDGDDELKQICEELRDTFVVVGPAHALIPNEVLDKILYYLDNN